MGGGHFLRVVEGDFEVHPMGLGCGACWDVIASGQGFFSRVWHDLQASHCTGFPCSPKLGQRADYDPFMTKSNSLTLKKAIDYWIPAES